MGQNETNNCPMWCWVISLAGGLLLMILLMSAADWSFFPALLVSLVLAVLAGIFLPRWVCSGRDEAAHMSGSSTSATTTAAAATTAGAATAAAAGTAAAAQSGGEDSGASADDSASAVTETSHDTDETAQEAESDPVASPAAAAAAAPIAEDENETEELAAPAAATSLVKPSTPLAGQAELAARKGTWKYAGNRAAPPPAAVPPVTSPAVQEAAPVAATAPEAAAPAAAPAEAGASADASKPELLSEARAGGADDLKQIKGVGPQMEAMLHSMGVFHFDQIGSWSASEAAWVDQNLPKFRGRVARDGWVEQAKVLAAGGETEFSKKVEKGGVY